MTFTSMESKAQLWKDVNVTSYELIGLRHVSSNSARSEETIRLIIVSRVIDKPNHKLKIYLSELQYFQKQNSILDLFENI
jgi:hypothetical protein